MYSEYLGTYLVEGTQRQDKASGAQIISLGHPVGMEAGVQMAHSANFRLCPAGNSTARKLGTLGSGCFIAAVRPPIGV